MAQQVSRRAVRILGYIAFFLVLFLVFLIWTFPVSRFDAVLEQQLSNFLDRDVTIGKLGMTLTGGVVFHNVEIAVNDQSTPATSPPKDPSDKTKKARKKHRLTYLVDELAIDVGFMALLFDELDLEIEMDLLGGSLSIGENGRWTKHGNNAYYVQFTGDACTVTDTSSPRQNLGHVKVDE